MLGDVSPSEIKVGPIEPIIYSGHDNVIAATFEKYNGKKYAPLDFSAVTRMVLVLDPDGSHIVFDTNAVPAAIDWITDAANGRVIFDLSMYALTEGTYACQLVAYDSQHPAGQVVIDDEPPTVVSFSVREVLGAGALPPPTLPSGGTGVSRTSGEQISPLKVVYEYNGQVFLTNPALEQNVELILGLTLTGAAEANELIVVQVDGTVDDASWSWVAGPVYLAAAGTLTQTVPVTGWLVQVGSSPSAQRINLNFTEPTLL
jgi:hypothetical protein